MAAFASIIIIESNINRLKAKIFSLSVRAFYLFCSHSFAAALWKTVKGIKFSLLSSFSVDFIGFSYLPRFFVRSTFFLVAISIFQNRQSISFLLILFSICSWDFFSRTLICWYISFERSVIVCCGGANEKKTVPRINALKSHYVALAFKENEERGKNQRVGE